MYTRIERQPPSWGHLPQKAGTIIRRSVGSMVMELLNYKLSFLMCTRMVIFLNFRVCGSTGYDIWGNLVQHPKGCWSLFMC